MYREIGKWTSNRFTETSRIVERIMDNNNHELSQSWVTRSMSSNFQLVLHTFCSIIHISRSYPYKLLFIRNGHLSCLSLSSSVYHHLSEACTNFVFTCFICFICQFDCILLLLERDHTWPSREIVFRTIRGIPKSGGLWEFFGMDALMLTVEIMEMELRSLQF